MLAAFRVGIREIILPAENDKDIEDIPEEIRKVMHFHLVSSIDEVLPIALVAPLPVIDPRPVGVESPGDRPSQAQ